MTPETPRTPNRLARMPGTRARSTCAAAIAACALTLAACGGDDEGTIPREQGETLLAQLAEVERSVDTRNCDAARATADEFVATVSGLPAEVGQDVKAKLLEAGKQLEELAADPTQCEEPDTGTTDTGTTSTTSTTETTSTTDDTTTDETTTHETTEPPSDPGGPPEDTPGNGDPGGPGDSDDDFEGGGSSGGIGAG